MADCRPPGFAGRRERETKRQIPTCIQGRLLCAVTRPGGDFFKASTQPLDTLSIRRLLFVKNKLPSTVTVLDEN